VGGPLFIVAIIAGLNLPVYAQVPAPPPGQYVFVSIPDRRVSYEWGGVVHIAVIGARGSFRVEKELSLLEALGSRRSPIGDVMGFPKPVKAYEYRSGRLILGTFTNGEFVPEAGSTVKKFEDYKYGNEPWIWNLPGYFVRKDQVEPKPK
jgi:hypothetical protein